MSAATATDTFSLIGMEQRMRQLEDAFAQLDLYAASVQYGRKMTKERALEIARARDHAQAVLERIREDQEILMRALRK